MVSPGQTTITAGFGSQFGEKMHSELWKMVAYEVDFAPQRFGFDIRSNMVSPGQTTITIGLPYVWARAQI